jgi:23S rRNA pseudouridine2605 synthase
MERLQKAIAKAGVASRREAERLIAAGRVRVNGQVVTILGTKVDPERDRIEVDGRPIRTEAHVYVMLNKPAGYVTTAKDPQGRPTVLDLVASVPQRVFPVGRLDRDTRGLLLLTNDGYLAHRLTHPSFEVVKVYRAKLQGAISRQAVHRLRNGVLLDGRMTAPAQVRVLSRSIDSSWIEIAIHEGRNRQVRRMAQAVGFPVIELVRIQFGPLRLGDLPSGNFRYLQEVEVQALRNTVLRRTGSR